MTPLPIGKIAEAGARITESITGVVGKLLGRKEGLKAQDVKVEEIKAEVEKVVNENLVELEKVFAQELETVNQTMREESKSEHWAQWLWRPMIGFTFCAVLVNNYILLPYFKNKGMEVIVIPDNVWTAILVILGAASAGRGLTQWQKAKQ